MNDNTEPIGISTRKEIDPSDRLHAWVDGVVRNLSHLPYGWMGISEIARGLTFSGRVGETVRVCSQELATPIAPLGVPFEPVPLDEAEASFDELQRALEPEAEHALPRHRAGETSRTNAPGVRRVKKNILLRGGWMLFATPIFIVAWFGFDAYQQRTLTWKLLLAAGFLAFPLLVPIKKVLTSRRQWFLVPGGLILRKASVLGFETTFQVHLFDRLRSVLCVHQSLRGRNIWEFAVADVDACEKTIATKREIDLLLRAWLRVRPKTSYVQGASTPISASVSHLVNHGGCTHAQKSQETEWTPRDSR